MKQTWKPPPYSHELAVKLGSLYFGDDRKNSPFPVHSVCRVHICGKDADWWHPDIPDAFCDEDINDVVRKHFQKRWIVTRYQMVIKNFLKKELSFSVHQTYHHGIYRQK